MSSIKYNVNFFNSKDIGRPWSAVYCDAVQERVCTRPSGVVLVISELILLARRHVH